MNNQQKKEEEKNDAMTFYNELCLCVCGTMC